MKKRLRVTMWAKAVLAAIALSTALVSGTANAGPGDGGHVTVLNHTLGSYCWDISPADGTDCGGVLKVVSVQLLK